MHSMDEFANALEAAQKLPDKREAARVTLALRHKLAMQAVGAIRLALNVHRPYFEALLNSEKEMLDVGIDSPQPLMPFREMMHEKSFAMQCKLAQLSIKFLDDLNEVADDVLLEVANKLHRS